MSATAAPPRARKICTCPRPRGYTSVGGKAPICTYLGCGGIRLDLIRTEEMQRDMLARVNAWERHYGMPETTIEVFRWPRHRQPARQVRVRRRPRRAMGSAR